MKRGFLFGLGCFFIVAVVVGIGYFKRSDTLSGAVILFTCVPLSFFAFRAGVAAPPHLSWQHAVAGWLVGFVCMDGALLVLAAIILALG